jgi:hypothetical protein
LEEKRTKIGTEEKEKVETTRAFVAMQRIHSCINLSGRNIGSLIRGSYAKQFVHGPVSNHGSLASNTSYCGGRQF